jgi:hypothetical protein
MIEKPGWQEAKAKSAEPKEREFQTKSENIAETAKEWVAGDFSNRDARNKYDDTQQKRAAEVEKRSEDLKKARSHNKDRSRQKTM